jgi:hypothetical protein
MRKFQLKQVPLNRNLGKIPKESCQVEWGSREYDDIHADFFPHTQDHIPSGSCHETHFRIFFRGEIPDFSEKVLVYLEKGCIL